MDWKLAVKTFFLTGSVGFLLGLSGAKLAWCSYQMWYENRGTNKTLIWRPKFLHNTQGLRSATWSVLSLLGLTSLSGWDIDVQLAGAQICVVSGSTDRNGRLWIVWIWITWVIHSNSLGQKMRSLLHRSVKGSSYRAFSFVFGLRFQAQATSLGCGHVNAVDEEIVAVTVDHLQQLGKKRKQGNYLRDGWIACRNSGFERRLLKGKWNLCFIISRNSACK